MPNDVAIDGAFSLNVTETGVAVTGPSGSVAIGTGGVVVGGSAGSLTLSPDGASLTGATIALNGAGGCSPAARVGVTRSGAPAGAPQTIAAGSSTVCIGNY